MKKIISLIIILAISFSFVFEASAQDNSTEVLIPQGFKVVEKLSYVKLSWKKDANVSGYLISRSIDRDNWQSIANINNNWTFKYLDKTAVQNSLYYYSIKAYRIVNDKYYYSQATVIKPVFFGINFNAATYSNSVTFNWNKVNAAKGYEIYMSNDGANFRRIKTIKNKNRITYTKTKITPSTINYSFYLKVFKLNNGVRKYIYQSSTVRSNDIAAIVNGSVGEPKKSFKVFDVQGKKAKVAWKNGISDNDRRIMANFNANYLTNDMAPYDRIWYTFYFIHRKVFYATGELYSTISSRTYVDAIFNQRLGQCVQYNGAIIAYMANMGLKVKLLQGYRGKSMDNKWQHFWGQVKLSNGQVYVIETGNYGNDGNWYYFFKPYSQTKKYLKCGKYVSGIK